MPVHVVGNRALLFATSLGCSGPTTGTCIRRGLRPTTEHGVYKGEGQLALASKMINSQVINRVVRQYIDGEIDAATAVAAMNEQLSAIE